jgi:histone H3/H4
MIKLCQEVNIKACLCDPLIIINIATLTQMIKDLLPEDTRMSCQSSDLIIQLTMRFLNYLSDTSNNVCNDEGKKTITPSHVAKALKVS